MTTIHLAGAFDLGCGASSRPFKALFQTSFLAPATVINVGDHQDHNVNVVIGGDTHHQDLMGMDPMVMPSQQEHWLQMQIPAAINIHQH